MRRRCDLPVRPRRRSASVLLIALAIAAAAIGCVQRNVERISSEEAASLPAPPPPQPPGEAALGETAATTRISGTVDVPPDLAGSLPSGATLYLIVRVAGREGGAPLAVQQIPTPTFPHSFEITERDAMIEGTPLMGEMSVTARLDQDGDAFSTEPGDFSGQVSPVVAGDSDITLMLAPVGGEGGS